MGPVRSLLVASIAAACAAPKPPAPVPAAGTEQAAHPSADQVTLVFAASVAGQIVPCGCSPDQRGGLPRAVALMQTLRRSDPNLLFVDGGDLLFESPTRPPAQMLTQRQLKARTLAKGDQLLDRMLHSRVFWAAEVILRLRHSDPVFSREEIREVMDDVERPVT